ncbi:hypothetical protein ABTX81_02145 [Kitasatospora sp. NPDC097605]|uniref:hypothetical protein n=1 Tax=Kitasatospora sp. NPDC097605 TaxID=3157226 RepID=UPI003317966D
MSAHDVARRLPAVPALRDLCRAMAAAEAVLAPDDPYRRHGHAAHGAAGCEVAWMDNGAGDSYTIVFSAAGAIARGFDHESPLSPYAGDGTVWPGVLDPVPEVLRAFLEEPADDAPEVTVCLWREPGDDRWRTGDVRFEAVHGDDPDGADHLFALLLDGTPEGFRDWAEAYYERPVALDAVRHLYAGHPLTAEVVAALDPDADLARLRPDLAAIGYPGAGDDRP